MFPNQPNQETQVCSAFRQNSKFPSCWHESRPDNMKTRSSKTNWIVLVVYPMISTGWLMVGLLPYFTIFHQNSSTVDPYTISPYFTIFYPHITIHNTGRYITLRRILIPCTAAELRAELHSAQLLGPPTPPMAPLDFVSKRRNSDMCLGIRINQD